MANSRTPHSASENRFRTDRVGRGSTSVVSSLS
jgi:hypothetical protein